MKLFVVDLLVCVCKLKYFTRKFNKIERNFHQYSCRYVSIDYTNNILITPPTTDKTVISSRIYRNTFIKQQQQFGGTRHFEGKKVNSSSENEIFTGLKKKKRLIVLQSEELYH